MPPHHDREHGTARENLCRFLAACYYQPGPEYAEEKVFESMLDAATRIHPDLAAHARRLGEDFSAEGSDSLLIDYTRLFLGPNHIIAKPYGSAWLDGEKSLMQDSTMAVEELYQEGGFEMDENFRELPDHIAAELEFLYLLIYRENEARRNDDSEALTAMAGLRTFSRRAPRLLDRTLYSCRQGRRTKRFLPRARRTHRSFRQDGVFPLESRCLSAAKILICVDPECHHR